ncbi:Ca-activated chloride channel homolog [Gammaproteobacteria bacterium]
MNSQLLNDIENNLHFLRPFWFLALLPLGVLLWLLWRRRLVAGSWRTVVDPRLLPYLLLDAEPRRRSWPLLAVGCAGLLAILALAGPVWRKLEQPVFRQPSSLVVLLDLSRSMDTADLKPSRLERARLKLQDILRRRREGQTALVVFAAQPFVVSPLTSDSRTIASQVPSLTTDLIPEQGSRLDRAIDRAHQLLKQSGVMAGTVLVIGDDVAGTPAHELEVALERLVADGHRIALLGVGTAAGAPIPMTDGGFLKDTHGAIVLPRLDEAALAEVMRRAHGLYRSLTPDDSDLDALLALIETRRADAVAENMKSDQWHEEGPWLLLPLLVLGALAFRRGYLVVLLLPLLSMPRPAQSLDWWAPWQRPDQRAQQAMDAGDPARAAELFQDPKWRAAANYRAGNYQAALDALKGYKDSESLYNCGNALTRLGRLPEAMAAYDEAIKRDPDHQDAIHNRDLVKQWLDKQKKDAAQSPEGDNQKDDQGKNKKNDQTKNKKDDQSKNQTDEQDQQQKDEQGNNQKEQGNQQKKQQESTQQNQEKQREDSDSKESDNFGDSQQGSSGEKNDSRDAPSNNSAQSSRQDDHQSASSPTEKSESVTSRPVDTKDSDTVDIKQRERILADEQWLRRVPDDPGGLWRRKFLYQYRSQHPARENENTSW